MKFELFFILNLPHLIFIYNVNNDTAIFLRIMHTCKSKTMERNIIAKKGNFVLCAMVNIGRSTHQSALLILEEKLNSQKKPMEVIASSRV